MKSKFLKTIFLLGCCIPFIYAVAQNNPNQKTKVSGMYNYFLHPDSVHKVSVNPFLWKDYPNKDLTNPKDIKDMYKEAIKVDNGYKVLQLAKLEFDHVYTYGNLVPCRMLHEAYQIALRNSDPYLAFYILKFDIRYNQSILYTYEYMMKQVDSLATCHKNADVLYRLAALDDSVYMMKHSTPVRVRAKAMFINYPGFAPYLNPYDSPVKGKPLDTIPYLWKNYPAKISTDAQFMSDYNTALKKNDGYRLFQLAKLQSDKKIAKTVKAKTILQKAYNIGCYNKDPYLLVDICLFNKETPLLENIQTADIFRQAYHFSIERLDTKAIYFLSNKEKANDFLPDLTPSMIGNQAEKITKLDRLPIVHDFGKWIEPPVAKTKDNSKATQNKGDEADDDWGY
jgi:hypothetical protein